MYFLKIKKVLRHLQHRSNVLRHLQNRINIPRHLQHRKNVLRHVNVIKVLSRYQIIWIHQKDNAYEHIKSNLFIFLKTKIPFGRYDLDEIQYGPFVEQYKQPFINN